MCKEGLTALFRCRRPGDFPNQDPDYHPRLDLAGLRRVHYRGMVNANQSQFYREMCSDRCCCTLQTGALYAETLARDRANVSSPKLVALEVNFGKRFFHTPGCWQQRYSAASPRELQSAQPHLGACLLVTGTHSTMYPRRETNIRVVQNKQLINS